MIKNLKVLGLALVALVALSAAMASAASADNFTATEAPVTVTGEQDGGAVLDKFTVDGGTVECKKTTYVGTSAVVTFSTLTVTPTYHECTFIGLAATVNMNGCDYLLHINTAAGNTTGTVDIVCEAGKEITVTAPSVGTAKCIVHIPPKVGLGTITYSKVGAGTTEEVTGVINIAGIGYSQTAGEGLGKCASALNTTNGTYVGKAIFTGENDSATFVKHIGLTLE